jgi:hypothetical protein
MQPAKLAISRILLNLCAGALVPSEICGTLEAHPARKRKLRHA